MLQIASGRFFGDGERWEFEAKGILYSNMSWVGPIETRAGTLEPVDTAGSEASSYVLSYVNRMEKDAAGPVVRVGDEEIMEQFGWLGMIWFGAFFDGDKQSVVVNCREKRTHAGDEYVGSRFAKPYLLPERRITEDDTRGFARFVDKVIGLPRDDYLAVTSFLRTVSHALTVLRHNLDLAYSMLVYALEALSKGRSGYLPRWEDYDAGVKKRLDPILDGLEGEISEAVRGALLENAHLKLQQQFLDFVVSHLPDAFYEVDAEGVDRPVRPSELDRALKNAYRARSIYVHVLKPLIHQLKSRGIAEAEVFVWENKPYLTFNGLLRVARAVLLDFVTTRPYLEDEEYDWAPELPGLVTLMPAGQYWIWNHNAFSPTRSAGWLSAFLEVWLQAVTNKPDDKPVMPDLRNLLATFEALHGSASAQQKRRMLAIHTLYNHIMIPKSPGHERFQRVNEGLFDGCSIEAMVLLLLTGREFPWEAGKCGDVYEAYAREKFGKDALSLPLAVEVAIMAYVAENYREIGNAEVAASWSRHARLESAGRPSWQEHIREVQAGTTTLNLNVFFDPPEDPAAPTPTDIERIEAAGDGAEESTGAG